MSRTPYMIGIVDAVTEPGIEEIVCLKSAQVGWSTATETLIGYWIDIDPGPIMLVLDSEETAKSVLDERIRPMIDNTPAIKSRLSPYAHDNTLTGIRFDSCNLHMAWSGSPGTLARRAIRYGIFEEADKYKLKLGREADGISLGIERTATYGYRRRVLIGSTPSTRDGPTWKAWEAAGDKRRYHVPCPHCGEYQALVFGQLKWPTLNIADRAIAADTIEQNEMAHYECIKCGSPIKSQHRPKMLARGVWLSDGQTTNRAGEVSGNRPKAKRVGFLIHSLYSPWRSFSAIAAEFLRSKHDPIKLQNFKNSWLAEPFEEIVKTANVEDFRKLTVGAPPANIIPAWAEYIIASADCQKDRLYWIVRAWGADHKSQLITYGLATSFDELKRHTLETQYTLESGGTARAHALFIDSGYRTDEVYQFAKTDERIKPVKGDNDSQAMPVKYSTAGIKWGVPLWMLNTQLLKDRLAIFRNDPERWLLNDQVTEEYLQHLASEQKQIIKGVERWETKSSGAANHYLDCEVYQLAAAEILRVDLLRPMEMVQQAPAPMAKQEPTPIQPTPQRVTPPTELHELQFKQQQQRGWIGNNNGWLRK